MPSTPESTIGRKRFFSSSSSTAGGYGNMAACKNAYSSGYNSFSQGGAASAATSTSGIGGPANTNTLSPTPIFVNHETKDYSASSSIQKTFDPVIKQSHNYSTSSTTKTMTNSFNENSSAQHNKQKIHGFNKEEEEEELFNLAPNHQQNQIESDKQFRPIYQPVINETSSYTPTTTTPIPVTNISKNKKHNNFSTSSYEYSESQGNQPNQKWSNGYPQRFNSTQTISN